MKNKLKSGLTLLELSLVIVMIAVLATTTLYVGKGFNDWQLAREASESLRAVNVAQRIYLSDHPNTAIKNIKESDLIPYLPNQLTDIPTVEDLDGNILTIQVNVSPPVITASGGGVYDPSGASDDSLWDVGKQ